MNSIDGMTPLDHISIEKAAADCGFDLLPVIRESGLLLKSTPFPETVTAKLAGDAGFELQASHPLLLEGLPPVCEG